MAYVKVALQALVVQAMVVDLCEGYTYKIHGVEKLEPDERWADILIAGKFFTFCQKPLVVSGEVMYHRPCKLLGLE